MFLTTAIRNSVHRLLPWLQRRLTSHQWLIDRNTISQDRCQGIRSRVLVSRSLCLYYIQDLARVPAARRQQALIQQVRLLSPFEQPGFYVRWQGATAQLWLWDQAALELRLPQAAMFTVLPDSSLADSKKDAECWLAGVNGVEWQQWQNGILQDSRWQSVAPAEVLPQPLALDKVAPLQAADKQQLLHWGLAAIAASLVLVLLLQAGGALSLWRQQQVMQNELVNLNQSGQLQFQARRKAQQALAQWQARQALYGPMQLDFIQQLAAAVPEEATFWQRYQYEPGRLQLQLKDDNPDPRDYVRRLNQISGISNVQIQLDPGNKSVTVQAVLSQQTPST